MPDLERALSDLKRTTRAAMRRRRLATPGTEAWRQADEMVLELATLMGEVGRLLDRRRERRLEPVRVRSR
ncbi:MAG: hypothetical protein ACP5VP_01135 [Candidatus Limnocylindrales bacterium]